MAKNKDESVSVDEVVNNLWVSLGADKVDDNPKKGSKYGLIGLGRFLDLENISEAEINKWGPLYQGMVDAVQKNNGTFDGRDQKVLEYYGVTAQKITDNATVGTVIDAYRQTGYTDAIPYTFDESKDMVYGDFKKEIAEKAEPLLQKNPEDLSREETDLVNTFIAIKQLDGRAKAHIEVTMDDIEIGGNYAAMNKAHEEAQKPKKK